MANTENEQLLGNIADNKEDYDEIRKKAAAENEDKESAHNKKTQK